MDIMAVTEAKRTPKSVCYINQPYEIDISIYDNEDYFTWY